MLNGISCTTGESHKTCASLDAPRILHPDRPAVGGAEQVSNKHTQGSLPVDRRRSASEKDSERRPK
jgi:hypothetical protein